MNKSVDLLLGSQFGNYRLVRLLGRGGFASVYLGENVYINTLVAVKVLHTEIDQSEMEYFRLEARTIATLKHPHIVQLIDFGLENRMPYLVMSYAPHGHLRQLQTSVGAFPLLTVVSYVKQIASALQFAHDHKVIHRDIKPENILLDAQDSLLLSDFGIALIVQTTHQASSRGISGTLAYMAPEQTQGKSFPASDQYALGVTAYELLTGTRPFKGSLSEVIAQHVSAPPPSLREKVPTLPVSVEQVILRSLAKSPEERFPSVAAFAVALAEASELQDTQDAYQALSTSVSQSTPSPLASQSFEEKTFARSSFLQKEEQAAPSQFTNSHGLTVPSIEATPTTPLPSIPASLMPPPFSHISTSLAALTQSHTSSSPLLSATSPSTGIFPTAQNILSRKRSYRLLSLTLICVVLIVVCSALFMAHSPATHIVVQTGFIKQSLTVPASSVQQSPATSSPSASKVGKSLTPIARSGSTPAGTLISTTTVSTFSPAPLPTATPTTASAAIPTIAPTPTPIPTTAVIPSPTTTAGACSGLTGYYKIVNRNSGKNLDVASDALTDGALIVQFADNGKTDQQWSFVATDAGYCKIVNRNSGSLLNIPGPTLTSATQLIQFHDDGHTNSQWKLVAVGNNSYKIVSRYDSQCIDVSQSSISDNAAVIQFPDHGGLNQQWQLVHV